MQNRVSKKDLKGPYGPSLGTSGKRVGNRTELERGVAKDLEGERQRRRLFVLGYHECVPCEQKDSENGSVL